MEKQDFSILLTEFSDESDEAFISKIKAEGHIPVVIVISWESRKERVVAAIKAGIDDYILKPHTEVTLTSKILDALEKVPHIKDSIGAHFTPE